ncbi:zinc finger BED domain-containing protein 4-like [Centruroides vittatus]|uniref:zinc finger BED domain-containing protein 4-like n=1 Tax=Centruroides vittatus TaxID=120091 RepID=UPI00350FE786
MKENTANDVIPCSSKSMKQLTPYNCQEKTKKWDINDPQAVKYHYLIAKMIAIDNEPVNIVERSGFKRLLNETLPRYAIPSRPYFSEKIIPERQHTAQNIANALQEILSQWKHPLSNIHIIVHDNGCNIVKAISEAEMNSACCFIHTLQLVIKDSLNIQPEVEETIAVGQRIVTHFNHSSTVQEKLKKIQEELRIATHNLVQDITTRWNSTCYMLERLLEQKRAIFLYLTDTTNISNLTAEQWEIVDQLLKLLKPFEEITKITSSNYYCLSEIIPHAMAIAMQQEIKQRYSQIDNNKNYLISTLLDPRFKTNFFTNQVQKERARQYILLEDLVSDYDTSSNKILLPCSLNVKELTSLDKAFAHLSGSAMMK